MDVLRRGSVFTCQIGSSSLERLQQVSRHHSVLRTTSSWPVCALTVRRDGPSSRNLQLAAANQHGSNTLSSDQVASAASQDECSKELTDVVEPEEVQGGEDAGPGPAHLEPDGVGLVVEKTGRNKRRIVAAISIGAPLDAVWGILTAYERLADFIPGLAVSELLEKGQGRALVRQVGQQDIALGIKFKAEAVMEVTEHPVQICDGIRRFLDFQMVKGDFELFSGTWGMEQKQGELCETTLSYTVDVQPKPWLPVGLLEGRLSKDIKLNLICVRDAAVAGAGQDF